MNWLLFCVTLCLAQQEVFVTLPAGGRVGLSTRGPSSFRVRFLFDNKTISGPIDSPLIGPDQPDAQFKPTSSSLGTGIIASIGSVLVSSTGILSLLDARSNVITKSQPLGGSGNTCSYQHSDVTSCIRVASPMTVGNQAACCAACDDNSACTNWIYGPGSSEGNCWLIKEPQGIHPASDRVLGGVGMGGGVILSTNSSGLYGGGGGSGDSHSLTLSSVSPHVLNRETYVSHYYSPDGYAALGVVNVTSGGDIPRYFPASWSTDGSQITWTSTGPFELYLMPAATLDLGTRAYFALTGQPRVPPRYAFGFFASRWGWTDRAYIEDMLHQFRDGLYPIDSIISDFEWFTNESDYNFSPTGEPWYDDFGFNPVTFPDPVNQLKSYHNDLHVHMGGIRKPRLGNTATLAMAKAAGYLLPGGELASKKLGYAEGRNLNYSIPQTRDWYAKQEAPLLAAGVDFFWNDEGETEYFTFHWWNIAQIATLRMTEATKRFFSINRAWTPGMARLGATVWTGDINPTWGDMQSTPGLLLNWGLGGGPYVSCDIGGFSGETQADLLARWFQVGVFMPVMRVHSTESATPHFPFLWPEPYRSAMRSALDLRYQLIPYHYSLAHTMYSTGALWMRPLIFDFPGDYKAASLTTQWLDGALMVAPVLTQDSNMNVYLPAGTWYIFNSSQTIQGPTTLQGSASVNEIPVYTRPGAVITLAPVVQYADALPGGPLEVQVYAGADGQFSLIEDDGATTTYESGVIRVTSFKWNDASRTLSWLVSGQSAPVANNFVSLYVTLFSSKGVQRSPSSSISASGSISF